MIALLAGGPANGETRIVPARLPAHIDVEVAAGLLTDMPEGGEYPPTEFERHRYVLDNVAGDPKTQDTRAKYSWLQRLPDA